MPIQSNYIFLKMPFDQLVFYIGKFENLKHESF